MKKFIWPLQRLLDVKQKQENALQMELVALMEQGIAIRSRMMMLKMMLQKMLGDLKQAEPDQRLARQQEFMRHVHIEDAKIRKLGEELDGIEKKRNEKMAEMMKLRKFRKALERLRAKAFSEYRIQMNHEEQRLLDENTNITFARKILMS